MKKLLDRLSTSTRPTEQALSTPGPAVDRNFGNGNGDGVVSGRGLLQRPYNQRLSLAAAYKLGQLKVDPSLKQTSDMFHVSQADLRDEILSQTAWSDDNAHSKTPTSPAAMAAALADMVGLDTALDLLIAANNRRLTENDTGRRANASLDHLPESRMGREKQQWH